MGIVRYNRKEAMKLEHIAEGVLVADGTEQTLIEDVKLSNLSGFLDLAQMQIGDTVTVRQYVLLNSIYKLYAGETYNDAQIQPALHLTPKGASNKMKITLQQTAGAYRQFAYEFIREV